MKLNQLALILLVLITLSLSSCDDLNQPENKTLETTGNNRSLLSLLSLDPDEVDGSIMAQAHTLATAVPHTMYAVTGSCFANGTVDYDSQIAAGNMIASNAILTLNQFPNVGSEYGYNMNQCSVAQYYPTYGDTTNWGFTGSQNVVGFNHAMYVKPEIIITSPWQDFDDAYHKTNDFIIQWNGTNSNEKIGIALECDEMSTYSTFGYYPNLSYSWVSVNIDDDGSYTIPASIMSNFPDSCVISVKIGRTNYEYVDINSKTYAIEAFSFSSGCYKLLP